MQLTQLQIAIVVANVISRVLSNYKHYEQPKAMQEVSSRIGKMMRSRYRTNQKEFNQAMRIEMRVWREVVMNFDNETPLYVVDLATKLHSHYEEPLKRFANLSEKVMERLGALTSSLDDAKVELESNDNNIVNKFIDIFEPYSGVKRKRSLLAGRGLIIKNNLIIEGAQLAEGF